MTKKRKLPLFLASLLMMAGGSKRLIRLDDVKRPVPKWVQDEKIKTAGVKRARRNAKRLSDEASRTKEFLK